MQTQSNNISKVCGYPQSKSPYALNSYQQCVVQVYAKYGAEQAYLQQLYNVPQQNTQYNMGNNNFQLDDTA